MDLGLKDSVCVVTGSTAGIGLEVARLLQAEGARRTPAAATTGSASCTSPPTSRSPASPSA